MIEVSKHDLEILNKYVWLHRHFIFELSPFQASQKTLVFANDFI